jgi:hypothetical protein
MSLKTGTVGHTLAILRALVDTKGLTAVQLKALLGFEPKSALTSLKDASLIRQSKKYEPYILTAKAKAQMGIIAVPKGFTANPKVVVKKTGGAPQNGVVTNGQKRLTKPDSMSAAMFAELCREHASSERRAEAIENLLHNWPR